MTPRISVLLASRKNSKYLAKFLSGYSLRTSSDASIELLVMMNQHDDWNFELVQMYMKMQSALQIERDQWPIRFYKEDYNLGRGGLHKYFNELYSHARGDWIVYFCEDHFITMPNWDQYVLNEIDAKKLNPAEPWCLVPKFDNVGAMNHILSRGFIEAMHGSMGQHGWIDSYINELGARLPRDRTIRFDDEMFHDFTHDQPHMLDDSHTKTPLSEEGKNLPMFNDPAVTKLIDQDADRINKALEVK